MPEKIGQVSLNYDHYSGKDLYSDGEIEDILLDIVRNSPSAAYQSVIEEKKSWPILYHLSSVRGNIVASLPISKEDKVLEIGSGCGAITSMLSEMAKSVTCVDLSAKRSHVNAYRNQDRDNITIHVGNFADIEPNLDCDFDYICLIGVFEYASSYIDSDDPYVDMLKKISKHAKNNGRIVIAIENRLGLKYWAGCKEDHNGEYFASLEGYPKGGSARTFTRNGLEKIFGSCGIDRYSFYYPYPDYKLPWAIYSDKHLPGKGQLTDNIRNLDRDRLKLFDESRVYDTLIEDGEFPLFSNSYMAILGPDIDLKYAKYSNDRDPRYAIKTEITSEGVKKIPMSPEAREHVAQMAKNHDLLKKRYEGSKLKVNKCTFNEEEGYALFEFVDGITLEERMDEALDKGDKEAFKALFDDYYERIDYNNGENISDLDLIFSNILTKGDEWTIIDYEWCREKKVEAREIAFRALYCYVLEDERRNLQDIDELFEKISITPNEAEYFREKEVTFQKEVTGHHLSIGEIRANIGTHVLDAVGLAEKKLRDILDERIQIYYDRGMGFSEQDSKYVPDVYEGPGHVVTDIEFKGDIKNLRIDPADDICLVKINELILNGMDVLSDKKFIQSNGKMIKTGSFVFETADPNLIFALKDVLIRGENVLHIDMEIVRISKALAENISSSVKKLF
ncbi:MAG: class I SAM-dependent methyltransferase [Lachnospiraceae bacterium]|nr:class I SAM-dependent methyltransferase [Lachnospiraceae bacterium]